MRIAWLFVAAITALGCSESQKHPLPASSGSVSATAGSAAAPADSSAPVSEDFKLVSTERAAADWPEAGRYERTLDHDGVKRRYVVQIPPSYRPDKKAPILFMLHGEGDLPEQYAREGLGISLTAVNQGWVAVFPQGSEKHENGYAWRHGLCADGDKTAEVAFFGALIDALAKDLTVDQRRIYVMGFASGGSMAQVLGAELADRLAAIASIAGMSICQREGGEEERVAEPKEPMNALLLFPGKDPNLPLAGGKGESGLITGSSDAMTAIWTSAAQCGEPEKKGKETDAAVTIDHDCKETDKHVLAIVLNKTGRQIPPRIGNKPTMDLVGRFFEGSFRKAETEPKPE